MDAFYASVEQRDKPDLRGKPVVVGGDGNRGVVAAASYESRRFGIRSAMPMRDARRRCPELICVHPRMAHYQAISAEIFTLFREVTPLVEGLSLDEAFLDVSASMSLLGSGEAIARSIRERVRVQTGLTASVGVAPNKLVAKIASDLGKPDGLVVVTAGNVHEMLDPLPARVIPGIGPETDRKLAGLGLRTIADLRSAPDAVLHSVFGRFAERTRERACGVDDRPVVPERAEKSISAEETYDIDLADVSDMQRELLRLTDRTAARLRAKCLAAGTVQVKIRQSDFKTFTRQRSLHPASNDTALLYEIAWALLRTWLHETPGARVRLLGVGGSSLVHAAQADLFGSATGDGDSSIDRTVDAIRTRFGQPAVGRARTLGPRQIR
jgi:DNA polymerase-4